MLRIVQRVVQLLYAEVHSETSNVIPNFHISQENLKYILHVFLLSPRAMYRDIFWQQSHE